MPARCRPRALLCDRDGTLIRDVPYNGDPDRVEALPGVSGALDNARDAGLLTGIVTNQRGLALGAFGEADLAAVHERIDELLGPFSVILFCPHDAHDGCDCRKPEPGMIRRAADLLGVPAEACVVIGDTGADVEAARRAGARGVLVPNEATRQSEVDVAPEVWTSFSAAVEAILGYG